MFNCVFLTSLCLPALNLAKEHLSSEFDEVSIIQVMSDMVPKVLIHGKWVQL